VLDPVRSYFDRLNRSFAACWQLLEHPRTARRAVVGLLAVHSALLAYSAYVHSPTLNEPGHLVAGLSTWKFGRFDVYNVNPPLVKMVAALPVIAAGYDENWSGFSMGPGARPELAMGEDFVAANGERSFFLFMIARWMCMPFSWLGAIVCYLWARDLFGRPCGVIACATWCFEPNILAHASLITPDAHASSLGLAACYTFWRWLKNPTWAQAAVTGVVLGLAELAKTTLILFYPLWPVMWIVYRLSDGGPGWRLRLHGLLRRREAGQDLSGEDDLLRLRHSRCGAPQAEPPARGRNASFGETCQQLPNLSETRMWIREGGMLALRMAIGLYVLNLGYRFEGALRPLGEFYFVSDLFTGNESGVGDHEPAGARVHGPEFGVQDTNASATPQFQFDNPKSPNRFANTWLADFPSPFPSNYLLGIDLQQKDFEHYGRPSYLGGEWRDHGWWYYYLYAVAIKVPLGLWAIGVFALMLRLPKASGRQTQASGKGIRESGGGHKESGSGPSAYGMRYKASFRDLFILIFPPLVIFVVVSSKTGMNEHMRYVLPSFPFIFIGLSETFRNLVDNAKCAPVDCAHSHRFWLRRAVCPLFLTLLLWSSATSWWIYPHSLTYFNELIGGPLNGSQHLLGSNVDWGQDLRYAKSWIEAESGLVELAFSGGFDPRTVGLDTHEAEENRLAAEWDLVSIGIIKQEAVPVYYLGLGIGERVKSSYKDLGDAKDRIGYSLTTFRVVEAE
jgi:hypothetical protein